MRFPARLTTALWLTVVASSVCAQSTESNLTSSEGVVLLRNGQTLEGNITRTGDDYLVTRGATSEVRLPAAAVELVCANLESLYQHRVATIVPGDRASHLALARWCLQHDLIARAADQALSAFALDSSPQGLAVLERQLLATERQPETAEAGTTQGRTTPSLHEIAGTIEALPAGTVPEFVNSIQPLLLNRCATSGCHGLTSSAEFKLLRPSSRQALSRRMTHRNLFAALAYVDRTHPNQSRLLTLPRSPHGGQGAVFSEAEAHQIQMLAKWVAGIADQTVDDLPQSVAKPPAVLLQTRADAIKSLQNDFSNNESPVPHTSDDNGPTIPGAIEKTSDDYQPRDPFDPEVFNRRAKRTAAEPR